MVARTLKATITKSVVKEKLKSTTNLLSRLRQLAVEPQHALPDVFIWMISNNKRIAYHRVPAKNIVFSMVGEEMGKDCGKVQTLLLKVRASYSDDRTKRHGYVSQVLIPLDAYDPSKYTYYPLNDMIHPTGHTCI